jgi:3',5'-cyclic AMP phosphodiesterase CpdA
MHPPVLRLLHISDLHVGGNEGPDGWRRRRVLGDAWAANLDALLEDGPLDLICFTGDLAFSGKAEQYEALTPFIADLLHRVKLPLDRLFVVPGNHDIDRDLAKAARKALRELDYHGALGLSR